MALLGWDERPDGGMKVQPILSYSIVTIPTVGVVRLEYADTPEEVAANKGSAVQIGMSAAQARDLGTALLNLANRLDWQVP